MDMDGGDRGKQGASGAPSSAASGMTPTSRRNHASSPTPSSNAVANTPLRMGGIFDDEDLSAPSSQEPLSQLQSRGWGHASSSSAYASQWGVAGTPMTPQSPQGQHRQASTAHMGSSQRGSTPLSQSQRFGTPQSQHVLPRGDLGHHFRAHPHNAGVPGTPSSVPGTPMSADRGRGRGAAGIAMTPMSQFDETHNRDDDPHGGDVAEGDAGAPSTRIWGTNVSVETCMHVFRNFLRNFNPPSSGGASGGQQLSHYMRQLHVLHRTQGAAFNLNCSHLYDHIASRSLYRQLQAYPHDVIMILDAVVNEVYGETFGDSATSGLNEFGPGSGEDPAASVPGFRARIQVKPYGLREVSRMRDLDPSNIDQLVCITGMIIRCSPVMPDLKQAFFRCAMCGHTLDVLISRGRIEEPSSCPECKTLGSMALDHGRGIYADRQLVRVQETPDEVPEGETPHTVTLFAFDDLVDAARPGDRVEITGVFRAVARRSSARQRSLRALYRTYVDAVHMRRLGQGDADGGGLGGLGALETNAGMDVASSSEGADGDNSQALSLERAMRTRMFPPEKIAEFEQFARTTLAAAGGAPTAVYDRLVQSFAPSIWELEDVKRGLLCQLFGGSEHASSNDSTDSNDTNNNSGGAPDSADGIENEEGAVPASSSGERGGSGSGGKDPTKLHLRGDINVLLCGDPGTSKSQLLSYVHKLTPRGIYTSGKGSSAVGLTASVVRDPETRALVLESGALVLSDRGLCCIDEFDKMDDATRAVLHEAMEQQTVSISKAGILATLNARTAVLASANPVESRYNPRMSVVENIKLPPTLLSRFDLIYLVLDKPSPEHDRKLAKHLVSLYHDDEAEASAASGLPRGSSGALGASGLGSTSTSSSGIPKPGGSRTGGPSGASGSSGASSAVAGGDAFLTSGVGAVPQVFLREYIAYAKRASCPGLSEQAGEALVQAYLGMRRRGGGGGGTSKTISATPRQLESLIRIAQALCKMRLGMNSGLRSGDANADVLAGDDLVTAADVAEAARLVRVATQAAATDPRTGTIDMDMITTGRGALDADLAARLAEALRAFLHRRARPGQRLTVGQLRQMLVKEASGGYDHEAGGSGAAQAQQPQNHALSSMWASVSLADLAEAARELEAAGEVQFSEATQTVLVRASGGSGN